MNGIFYLITTSGNGTKRARFAVEDGVRHLIEMVVTYNGLSGRGVARSMDDFHIIEKHVTTENERFELYRLIFDDLDEWPVCIYRTDLDGARRFLADAESVGLREEAWKCVKEVNRNCRSVT